MNSKTNRIAVFGGSFDPPHKGHFSLAHNVLNDDYADEIMFIPALHPPHKSGIPMTSFNDRMTMLRLGIKSFDDNFSVNDIEGRRVGVPSYTYDTLTELSAEFADSQLLLLIGEDSLINLYTWYNAEKIVADWRILTFRRNCGKYSVLFTELSKFWPEKIASNLTETILPYEKCDVSSTEIRGKVNSGLDPGELLFPEIYNFIKKRGLYKSD